jgi:hypothetical protein
MNDTLAKILKLLFNKTTLAYIVLGLVALYAKFWFNKSEYSPKSIKESIDNYGYRSTVDAKASVYRDSMLQEKLDEISHDQFIMRMQIDTMSNHQTPAVINSLKLIRQISNQINRQESRNTGNVLQPISPIIKTEPIDPKYAETMSLIDEIGLTMKSDTSKKKIDQESL